MKQGCSQLHCDGLPFMPQHGVSSASHRSQRKQQTCHSPHHTHHTHTPHTPHTSHTHHTRHTRHTPHPHPTHTPHTPTHTALYARIVSNKCGSGSARTPGRAPQELTVFWLCTASFVTGRRNEAGLQPAPLRRSAVHASAWCLLRIA